MDIKIPEHYKRTILDKLRGKNKPFRIQRKSNWKDRMQIRLSKLKLESKMKEPTELTNVIHIAEDGDIYLIPAIQNDRMFSYQADKKYQKKYRYDSRISIHYWDGKTEEGLLTDSFAPTNFKVNPSIEKNAIHSKIEFENAYNTFEKDLLRLATFSFSDKTIKLLVIFFIAGLGLGLGGSVLLLLAGGI